MNFKNKKILHFGNIANNAYLNSKYLRDNGYCSDVISLNYKHIMGQPEWEDSDITSFGDQFDPHFKSESFFVRPSWFYDGSIKDIIKKFKKEKKIFNHKSFKEFFLDIFYYQFFFLLFFLVYKTLIFFFNLNCKKNFHNFLLLHKYHIDSVLLKRIFNYYDFVIFYGATSIYGYLSNSKYYCYEHGTIRNFPYQNNLFGNLVNKAYKNCNHLFITNCDAINDAKKIGINNFSFIPHPVNESLPIKNDKEKINQLIKLINGKDGIKIFHPARQHWSKDNRDPSLDKGNDIFWDGLKKLKDNNKSFFCIAVKWGDSFDKTLSYLDKLEISKNVLFIEPLCHFDFVRILKNVDILADQFYLGSFGSLAPKALMLGVPVLINYNQINHSWALSSDPPFINCKSPEDVFNNLNNYYKMSLEELSKASSDWYFKNHNKDIITKNFIRIFNNK